MERIILIGFLVVICVLVWYDALRMRKLAKQAQKDLEQSKKELTKTMNEFERLCKLKKDVDRITQM